jgi:hypothetical protein
LQLAIRDKRNSNNSRDVNNLEKNILDKFDTLLSISETKFVLPEKLIDTILILFTKFFDICYSYDYSDLNILADKLPIMIIKFLSTEQNFQALNLSRKEFIRKKWDLLENLLIFIISFIDKYQNEQEKNIDIFIKFDLQTYLKNIINCFELLYFSLDENISDNGLIYKIMPGVVSKIIKLLSYKDIKLTSKILKILVRVMSLNLKIIFEKFKTENSNSISDEKFNKNFITFFDFYNIFHLKLKESVDSKKLSKIISHLLEMNIMYVKEFTSNKERLQEIFKMNKINFDDFFIERAQSIFQFLNGIIFNKESFDYPDEFLSMHEKLYNPHLIKEKINQIIKDVSVALNKQEFDKFNNLLPNLMIYFMIYLRINSINEDSVINLMEEKLELKNILDFEDKEDSNKIILESIYDILFNKMIKIKEILIFELVNNYEIQINSISKSQALEMSKKLILETLTNEKEIEYNKIFKFLNVISRKYPYLNVYFLNKHSIKINKSTKTFRKIFSTENTENEEEEIRITINEIKSTFDDVLKILISLILGLFTSINFDENVSKTKANFTKLLISLKQYSLYYSSFLSDYQDQFDFIKPNKILLLNSLLIQINSFLLDYNKKIFNKNEKNNILMLALSNYSNKMQLLKYSSLLFLINYTTTSSSDKLELKEFVKNNFDFIINTTVNKIIYFDKKDLDKKNSSISKSISNYKLDILNFFNSLILFLKDLEDENLTNHYCGEMNNFVRKLFIYLDMFFKEKNFFNLECLLEIIEKITNFQNYIIEKNWGLFKVEKNNINEENSQSQQDQEYNKISDFFKENMRIKDSNLFRNLILRIDPLLLCNKLIIVSKCIKIFENLIHVLYILPMNREEKTNFSTEDGANVIVKSSLGPIMHESWPYFIYILKNKNQQVKSKNNTKSLSGNNLGSSTTNNLTNQNFKMILELFIKVTDHYPKFFNESRLFIELLPIVQGSFNTLILEYSFSQIIPLFSVFLELLEKLNKNNNKIFCSEENSCKIIEFLEDLIFHSQDSTNYNILPQVDKEKIHNLIQSFSKSSNSNPPASSDFSVKLTNFKNKL